MTQEQFEEVVTVPVAVGERGPAVKALGPGGWSWGDIGRSGKWMTIPGSAYNTPKLGRSPGSAYVMGRKLAEHLNPDCAFVVPVYQPGVTITQTGYWVLQRAEPRPLTLANSLAFEDQEEQAGVIDGGSERATCHTCKAWATPEHVASPGHHERLMVAAAKLLNIY